MASLEAVRLQLQARVVKQEELLDRNSAEAQRALSEMKAEMDQLKARHEVRGTHRHEVRGTHRHEVRGTHRHEVRGTHRHEVRALRRGEACISSRPATRCATGRRKTALPQDCFVLALNELEHVKTETCPKARHRSGRTQVFGCH